MFSNPSPTVNQTARSIVDSPLLRWLLLPRCLCCGSVGSALCAPCLALLPPLGPACPVCALPRPVAAPCPACLHQPPAFAASCAAYAFADPLRAWLWQLKRSPHHPSLPLLAAALAQARCQQPAPLPQRLLAVPLSRGRLWRRGFNQSELLAQQLSTQLGIPLAHASRQARPDQRGLNRTQRLNNLLGAFHCPAEIAGREVALIDDVMTTGATAQAMALAAQAAGASRVEVWVLARVAAGKAVR